MKGDTFKGHFIRGSDDELENMTMRNRFLDTETIVEIVIDIMKITEVAEKTGFHIIHYISADISKPRKTCRLLNSKKGQTTISMYILTQKWERKLL